MGIQVIHCFDSVGLSLHARAPGLPISLKHMEDLHTALLFFFQLKQSKKPEIRKQTNKQKRKRLYYLKLHLSLLGWIGSVLSADDLRGQGLWGPGAGVMDSCELTCLGAWEPSWAAAQERQVSLMPPHFCFLKQDLACSQAGLELTVYLRRPALGLR